MLQKAFAYPQHSELRRALCVLIAISLIALPLHATSSGSCQQASGTFMNHTAPADAEFVKAATADKLRPVGTAITSLDDGSSLVTSVAKGQYTPEQSGTLFFRRDTLSAPGSVLPGLIADTRLGMDRERDVLWVKVKLSLPGGSSLKPASLNYVAEYRASELPAFQTLGTTEATSLLNEWAATARPLSETTMVARDGVAVAFEDGGGSFERAVEAFVPSRDTAAPLKSRSSCRQTCATRYLGSVGRFDVACIIVHALVCVGVCYVSYGTACAACLGYLDGLCGFLGSVVSLFNYVRCYVRC